ncbi:MAG: T9SS type A sorting domain-containing protein [Bacteroidales bacterium]|nr:T9SS type A sorting domain-containing protein [Bacteroidales bacterium]
MPTTKSVIELSNNDTNNISVYPNPTTKEIYIENISEIWNNCILYIFDIYGKIVKQEKIIYDKMVINLPNRKGLYFIVLRNNKNQESKYFKIVKL